MWKPSKQYINNLHALYGDKIVAEIPHTVRKARRSRSTNPEAAEQIKVVSWARTEGLLLFSIPNGGKRSPWLGERERLMGLMAGASDLFLAMYNDYYHGFFIEMKAPGKKPTDLQYAFMERARQQGYHADWFDNADSAIFAIRQYLRYVKPAA